METKINILSDSEHELEVNLTYEEIKPEIDKAYKEESKKIEIPGFRKGKVPSSMLKKMYGDAIEYKASEKIANDKFWAIVEEQKLNPISTPKMVDLDFERDVKLFFKIQYEVKPVIDVKDYKGQEFKKPVFTVTEELVDEEVNNLLRSNATNEDTEEVEDKNHIIIVDLVKLDDAGNPEEGVRSNNLSVDLTDYRVNPELVNSAIGKKKGDTFTFEFHNDREVEENGEKKTIHEHAKYSADVKSVKKIVLPELNEEFIKKITKDKISTVEDLRKDIKDGVQNYYDKQSNDLLINSILSTVVKNNDFKPPHGFVHIMLDRLVRVEEERAKRAGDKRFDAKEAHKRLHNQAEWSAKWQIILESLAQKENLKVEDSELQELAEKEASEIGISADKLMNYYKETNRSQTLLEEKVIDFLKNNNNIKEINTTENQETNLKEGE